MKRQKVENLILLLEEDEELDVYFKFLQEEQKNNPILIGEPGVGKSCYS